MLFVLLLVGISRSVSAQTLAYSKTQADYEYTYGKFVKFYNNIEADSLKTIFSNSGSEYYLTSEDVKNYIDKLGTIVSYKYSGPFGNETDTKSNPMVYFKLVFSKPAISKFPSINEKKEHAACLSLDKNNKILGFSMITCSDIIDYHISKH